jgi:hypothetical protein
MRGLNISVAVAAILILSAPSMPAFAGGDDAPVAKTRPVVKKVEKQAKKPVRVADVTENVKVTSGPMPPAPAPEPAKVRAELKEPCPEGTKEHHALPADVRKMARAGQCYTRLIKPPVTETYQAKVETTPERYETRTIPAVTRWVEKETVIRPERVERVRIAAVTRQVRDTEVVEAASYREDIIPARYEYRKERVMVREAREEWVLQKSIAPQVAVVSAGDYRPVAYRQDGKLTWPGKEQPTRSHAGHHNDGRKYRTDARTQDVYCLELLPAEYDIVERKVEIEPERIRKIKIPAVTRDVTRTEIVEPERFEERVIPAVFGKTKVKEVVEAARTEKIVIPATYKMVTEIRTLKDAEPVWSEVLCERNATPAKIREIQTALKKRGYDPGAIDGVLGTKTVTAMQKFQADQGLAQGQISVDAAKELGVSLH